LLSQLKLHWIKKFHPSEKKPEGLFLVEEKVLNTDPTNYCGALADMTYTRGQHNSRWLLTNQWRSFTQIVEGAKFKMTKK
jgi:hypothetical protein